MARRKIEPDSLDRMRGLVRVLMAHGARQILIDTKRHKPVSRSFIEDGSKSIDEVRRGITKIFLEYGYRTPDTKLLKEMSLEYLDEMTDIATANPSYRELRDKVVSGKYDFVVALKS